MDWLQLLISMLAVWRVTHLFAEEDGPGGIIFLLRKKAGNSFFGKLMDCFECISIWMALPVAIWLGPDWVWKIILWFALSGGACLLDRATREHNDAGTAKYKED